MTLIFYSIFLLVLFLLLLASKKKNVFPEEQSSRCDTLYRIKVLFFFFLWRCFFFFFCLFHWISFLSLTSVMSGIYEDSFESSSSTSSSFSNPSPLQSTSAGGSAQNVPPPSGSDDVKVESPKNDPAEAPLSASSSTESDERQEIDIIQQARRRRAVDAEDSLAFQQLRGFVAFSDSVPPSAESHTRAHSTSGSRRSASTRSSASLNHESSLPKQEVIATEVKLPEEEKADKEAKSHSKATVGGIVESEESSSFSAFSQPPPGAPASSHFSSTVEAPDALKSVAAPEAPPTCPDSSVPALPHSPTAVFPLRLPSSSIITTSPQPKKEADALTAASTHAEEKEAAQLRATALTVERLIAAFASLDSSKAAEALQGTAYPPRVTYDRANASARIVGAKATVRSRPSRFFVTPTASSAQERGASGASSAIEGILEKELSRWISRGMTNGKEILQQTKRKPQAALSLQRGPPSVSVPAGNFFYHGASRPSMKCLRQGDRGVDPAGAATLIGAKSTTLGGEEDTVEVQGVQQAIQIALDRYFWSRVLRINEPEGEHSEGSSPILKITLPVATAMILDLLSVCSEIQESGRVGHAAMKGSSYPVLVRFNGAAEINELGRSLLHCLPFEAMEFKSEDATVPSDRRSICRLEYWVSSPMLWGVQEAIHWSLRSHLTEQAVQQAGFYYPGSDRTSLTKEQWNAAGDSVVEQVSGQGCALVPQHTSYFTLLDVPLEGGSAERPRRIGSALDRNVRATQHPTVSSFRTSMQVKAIDTPSQRSEPFGVGDEAVENLAYYTSCLATDVLLQLKKDRKVETSQTLEGTSPSIAVPFGSVCTAVTETIAELLEDAGVRSALVRRSCVKCSERAQVNSSSRKYEGSGEPCSARTDREKVQRMLAERDAERIVSKIFQEFRAEELASSSNA